MKREIKFRGKRADGSSWVYGDLRQENSGNKVIMTNLSTWGDNGDNVDPYGEDVIVNPDTIGQFTGLHDKNGKEIFEGDIIRNKSCKGVVVYKNGAFCLELGKSCGYVWLFCLDSLLDIGNIYDNPELLEDNL
jgi:uncharacterized phage protein (TIGR01671 family)